MPDVRIFIYEYNSTVVYGKDKDTFVGKANELLESIRIKRPDSAESRPILFLGHSLGGLLIKQALINAHNNPKYTPIKEATTGLAFFATPHNGGDWKLLSLGSMAAKIAVAAGIQQGDDILETLKRGSIFDIMQEQFRQQLMKYDIISFWGAWDDMVPPDSARLGMPGDRENVVKLNADHSGVCKYGASQTDQDNLEYVQFNIKDIYKKALQKPMLTLAPGFHGWAPDHPQGGYPRPPPPQQGAAGSSTPQPPPLPPRFVPPPSSGITPDVGTHAGGMQPLTGVMYEPTGTDASSIQVADHKNAGRWEQARELEQQMLNEYQRTLGVAHRTSLAAAYDYTATSNDLGYLEDASRWADWTFQTSSSALGLKDPITLKVNRIRGEILNLRGRHQEAEDILASTLVDQQDILGDDHPDTLETVKEVAMLCREMGRMQDAETRLRYRLETMTRTLGENHIHVTAAAIDLLYVVLYAQPESHRAVSATNTQLDQAAMLVDDIYQRLRASRGLQDRVTIRALRVCGEVRVLRGDTTAASDMLRRALSNAEALLGRDHPETIAVVARMILLCSRQDGSGSVSITGVASPAMRPWLERYALWLEQRAGLNIPETRSALNKLAIAYISEKKYFEAERYYERLVRSYQGAHSKEAQEANTMYQLCRMNTNLDRRAGGGSGRDLAGLFSRLGFLGN